MGYCFGLLILCLIFFFPLVFICCSGSHLCSPHEATALIHFSSSFSIEDHYASWECESAGIKSYPKTSSWKQGTDCCSWDGVTCDYVKGHIVALDLSCSWLYGNFPSNSTLFHLQYLEKLDLACNNFHYSELSSEFRQFQNLVYLNLSNTYITGKLPSQISHLSNLVSLDLSGGHNALTIGKQISLEGLIHNLTKVRHLFLDGIDMSSINPNVFINLSSSLRSLSLSECDLRGKFPKNIFDLPNLNFLDLGINQNLSLDLFKFNRSSNLQHLDLSWTSLSTELIDSIDHLQVLRYLDLSYSNLWGFIPRSLGNLLQLTYLDLSGNHLSGKLPSSLTNLTQLQHLRLYGNSLEGSIPGEITVFPKLISLVLSSNSLNGTLPSWLYIVPSLQTISLSDNQFSGHINEFQSKSLQDIDLDNNKLQGPIPSSILQQPNLTHLFLSRNYNLSLTSNVTATALPIFPNLEVFHLSSCNVNEFPQFLKGSKSLTTLDLSSNKIHGKIPNWMWDLGKYPFFSYLNLSHNSFTGHLPVIIINNIRVIDLSSNLIHGNLPIPGVGSYVLDISNNNLIGEISSSICNASDLQLLDLSHNNLSGMIPPCFGNLSKSLSFLNLKKNKLNGMIPPTFAKDCQLSNLNLNGNRLEGPLTSSILNCEALEVLDIGNNNINDTFPHWLGTLPHLQVLVLKLNRFHGSLHETRPRSNHFFPKIQIFDLSCNCFTGPLPVRYIKYFKAIIDPEKNASAMPYMGVQVDNAPNGFYSYSIGIVMKGLDVEVMKIFTMYTIIDLSKNKFQGEIPKVIGKLSSLKGLNLSHNNLGGYIPSSIGNLTNLEWLDLSSNMLVGRIPEQLLSLTSLSIFNVSENQLHGLIPQGKQFNTFRNDSYEGNNGLCGFPVSKGCDINKPPPPNLSEDQDGSKSELSFGWEVVLLGYGCGVVLGLSMGYVVFKMGKPKWIVNMVEDYLQKRRRKEPKIAHRNMNGRRRRRRV